MRGWTQKEAAERLEPFLGQRWSRATFSVAERSWAHAHRVRQFTGDELVAFAAAFDLPVAFFLEPPTDRDFTFAPPGAAKSLDHDDLRRLAALTVEKAVSAMFEVRSREERERAQQRVDEQFGMNKNMDMEEER